MPCPPSFEEQEFWRMDRASDEINEQLKLEQETINGITQLIIEVKKHVTFGIGPAFEEKIKLLINRNFANCGPNVYNAEIDLKYAEQYHTQISNGHKMLHYAEVHQCELRTILMELWRMTPIDTQQTFPRKEEIEVQKKIHLQHRISDR